MIMNAGRAVVALAVLAGAGVASLTGAAAAGSTSPPSLTRTLQLLDVAAPIDSFLDLGAPGPSTGDVEVFRDSLVWTQDGSLAGHADGQCTLIEASTGQFLCSIVAALPGGTVTNEGVLTLVPGGSSTTAITGGTGDYESAGGHVTLTYHPQGRPSQITAVLSWPRS
jgi:Allene oxide cyclase barrel like domain